MTTEQYAAAQERSQQVCDEMDRHNIRVTEISYHLGISDQTWYSRVRRGLDEETFMEALEVIGRICQTEGR